VEQVSSTHSQGTLPFLPVQCAITSGLHVSTHHLHGILLLRQTGTLPLIVFNVVYYLYGECDYMITCDEMKIMDRKMDKDQ
jgi:hypothetical protein